MFDKPGHLRRGLAPLNLAVLPYAFTANTTVKTG